MDQSIPLYNSQIVRNYLAYLHEFHPDLAIDGLLKYAGMTRYEVEDQGHWFGQEQVNRFQEFLMQKIGDPELPRKAGRFAYSQRASGLLRQYALGFLGPGFIYRAMDKLVPRLSLSNTIQTAPLGRNRMEITFTPKAGVEEQPFQCENRIGWMEAVPRLFTNRFALVEHPECLHRKRPVCRYIVSWEEPRFLRWRRIGRAALPAGFLAGVALFSFLPWALAGLIAPPLFLMTVAPWLYSGHLERRDLARTVESQSDAAVEDLAELKAKYNSALLFQELGSLTSRIQEPALLAEGVAKTVGKWLDYDRIMIFLPEGDKLRFAAGYGFTGDEEDVVKNAPYHFSGEGIDNPFSWAFLKQHPFLANDRGDLCEAFVGKQLSILDALGLSGLIVVPVVYQTQSLAILAAAHCTKTLPYIQSDISLLMGIASQLAVTLASSRSYIQLRESEAQYRLLADNATDLIFTLDHKALAFTYMSPSVKRLLGYTQEEICGLRMSSILTPDSLNKASRLLAEELARRGPVPDNPEGYRSIEVEVIRKDGSLLSAEVRASLLRQEDGRLSGVLGIARDITERRAAEMERAGLERDLRQAQKMEALGTLAGGIAHDFNNILAAVMGYAEMALLDSPSDSQVGRHLTQVLKASHRAKDLVAQILTFSRQSEQEKRPVQASLIVKEALKLLRASLPSTIEIRQNVASASTTVLADPTQIHQILMNLCTNAHHAMLEKGGVLDVTLSPIELGSKDMEAYPGLNPGRYVRISVSDTGRGIEPAHLPRIFDPYFTTKQKGVGTGLGLAVVHGIAKRFGGTVKVSSEVGKGSTFEVLLPRVEDAVEPSNRSGEALPVGHERILLVDDEEAIVSLGKEILERLGYKVVTRTSSIEALEAFRARPDDFDLVITDMTMPNMTGEGLAREILKIRPGLPVMLCTGFSEQMTEEKAIRMGIRAFLLKPLVVRELAVKIRQAFNGNGKVVASTLSPASSL
jgi:PAS domain S-box-containing protein